VIAIDRVATANSFTIKLDGGMGIPDKNPTNITEADMQRFFLTQDSRYAKRGVDEYSIAGGVVAAGLRNMPLEVVRKSPVVDDTDLNNDGASVRLLLRCNDPGYYAKLKTLAASAAQGLQILKRNLEVECKDTYREAELFFKLPINFFYLKHMLPGIPMTFALQPFQKTQFLKGIFETTEEILLDDVKFSIENFELMTFTVDGPDIDDKKINLDLRTLNVHTQSNIRSPDLTATVFSVSPSTEGLAIAFQDTRVDQNSVYSASDFKFFRKIGKHVDSYDYMKQLSRFWIQYGDTIYPNQPMDPKLAAGVDNLAVDWMQTLMQTGLYFSFDPESYQDWKTKGMYWFYQCARPKNARNTDVKVNTMFTRQPNDPNPALKNEDFPQLRILVFDIVRSVAEIVIQNGRVSDVYQQEIS